MAQENARHGNRPREELRSEPSLEMHVTIVSRRDGHQLATCSRRSLIVHISFPECPPMADLCGSWPTR
jgi:hypothetical protein